MICEMECNPMYNYYLLCFVNLICSSTKLSRFSMSSTVLVSVPRVLLIFLNSSKVSVPAPPTFSLLFISSRWRSSSRFLCGTLEDFSLKGMST